jgi:ribosomal-protein-serine acetyltransferase
MPTTAPTGPFFLHPCGDGVDLVLRTHATTVELHELTVANLDRLRLWERWADLEPTLAATFETTSRRLDAFIRGQALPCAIRVDGRLAGAVDLDIDLAEGTAELGVWVDASVEGLGVARVACRAVLDHAFAAGLSRIEARIASGNTRSRRLMERLGFTLEGTLRSAHAVGGMRQDVAVYGIVAEDLLAAPARTVELSAIA